MYLDRHACANSIDSDQMLQRVGLIRTKLFIIHPAVFFSSDPVAEWLMVMTSNQEGQGSNLAGGILHLMTVRCFIGQSHSLSPLHGLDMT